ncbi:MAG: hypothetical protein JNL87_13270 [Burkholderiaceae bacterium]|nr:hypothetical protein [Burkholderiaceae bacterium]
MAIVTALSPRSALDRMHDDRSIIAADLAPGQCPALLFALAHGSTSDVAERAASQGVAVLWLHVCGHTFDQVGYPRHVNLLYNETGDGLCGAPVEALSMLSLAQALGEPEAVFAWAHLGRLPRSVRSLIPPNIRVFRTCMAAGYHSALHSLRLLQTCPIHGCELADRCNCGELFTADQVVLQHMNPGYCRCGRMAFFTSQTCRRTTLRHDETRPMSMVAAWLERLAGVIRPLPSDRQARRAHDRILLDSVGA